MTTFDASTDPFESDDEWYSEQVMRRDWERGVFERADAEDRAKVQAFRDNERFQDAIYQQDFDWPAPDDERRVSQFDTAEEDRGER
jgi:hypothetical protein